MHALALDRIARRVADVTTSATTAVGMSSGLLLKKPCGDTFCDEYHMCSAHDLRCYSCHDYCNNTSNNFDARICEQQCQDYIHDFMKQYVTHKNIEDALNEIEFLKSLVICMTVLVTLALLFISVTLVFIWKRERRIRKIKNGGQDSYFIKKLASLQYLKKRDQQKKVNTVSETVANNQLQTAGTAAAAACTSLAATQTELTTVVAAAAGAAGSSSSSSASVSASSSASSSGQRTNTSSAGGSSRGGGSSSNSNKLPCEDVALEFTGYDNFALKVSPVLPGKTAAPQAPPSAQPHQLQFTP